MSDSRLFRILYYLLDRGHATAPELADKLEVSQRTIYRDVEALSSAGIPVLCRTGKKRRNLFITWAHFGPGIPIR